ncbi:MAG: SAF domain-containing protein [Clostridia bacterium]|nr:SAF domain-containing protein [Clostridia bacterium]
MAPINPMQRKARNSFLLGMLIMLIISAIIIGFLLMLLVKEKKQEQEEGIQKVCVLTSDVSSGEIIDSTMVSTANVPASAASSTALTSAPVDMKSKLDLKAGTVLTQEMLYETEDEIRDDLRKQEYNMIVLPVQMEIGDYIDIRLILPTGADFIVVSKKEVLDANETTVWLNMTEDEILLMSSAIVEAYKMNGAKLTATIYAEPGIQETATVTYHPSNNIGALINSSPNVVEEAKNALAKRYKEGYRALIEESVNNGTPENVTTKMQEEITKQKEERANYLNGL